MKKLVLAICLIISFSCTKEKTQIPELKTLNEKSEKIILNDKVVQEYEVASEELLDNDFDIPKLKELMKLKTFNFEK